MGSRTRGVREDHGRDKDGFLAGSGWRMRGKKMFWRRVGVGGHDDVKVPGRRWQGIVDLYAGSLGRP